MTISSCVNDKAYSLLFLVSCILYIISSAASHLPVWFQISLGCNSGISISWHPMAFISSRIIWVILDTTRHPNGKSVHDPAINWSTNPARTSNLWLTVTASLGAFFKVFGNAWEYRIAKLYPHHIQ